jgi:hypothetical protein
MCKTFLLRNQGARFSLHSSSYSPALWSPLSAAEVSVSKETGTGKGRLLFIQEIDGDELVSPSQAAQLTV